MGLRKSALLACCLGLALPAAAGAAVQVIVGPTPIVAGEAKSAGDITVSALPLVRS